MDVLYCSNDLYYLTLLGCSPFNTIMPLKQMNFAFLLFCIPYIVSRQSFIHGAQNVEMKGKSIIYPNVHIRGDMTNIRIGRYCTIGSNTIIRPSTYQTSLSSSSSSSSRNTKDTIHFLPSLIGNHTRIGSNCVIESASIGSCVYIANNVVLSKRVVIKDCCYIEEGTVIPSDMVIPPFSRVGGCPGKIMDDSNSGVVDPHLVIPESVAVTFVDDCIRHFAEFVEGLDA